MSERALDLAVSGFNILAGFCEYSNEHSAVISRPTEPLSASQQGLSLLMKEAETGFENLDIILTLLINRKDIMAFSRSESFKSNIMHELHFSCFMQTRKKSINVMRQGRKASDTGAVTSATLNFGTAPSRLCYGLSAVQFSCNAVISSGRVSNVACKHFIMLPLTQ
jgi:hypothetical protein